MFSSLRLRSKRSEEASPPPSSCQSSRKSSKSSHVVTTNRRSSSKWSIDKALCPGAREKIKDSGSESLSESIHQSRDTIMPEQWRDEYDDGGTEGITTRVVGVPLQKNDQGLGITLRGGRYRGVEFQPLTITHVKPNGPADREGTIKVGDRLLAVDGHPLTGLSLPEAQQVLREGGSGSGGLTWLTVEYDVSIMSRLRTSGPLLVEIDSPNQPHNLGLNLIDSRGRVIVSKVQTASIAERCGALLPGDQIIAVNEYRVENSNLNAKDVTNILNTFRGALLQIEILPVPSVTIRGSSHRMCPSPTLSGSSLALKQYALDGSMYAGESRFFGSEQPMYKNFIHDKCADLRIENGVVTLHSSPGQGFGLKLRWVPSKMASVICDIEPNSVSDRSGVLQIGDRVTSVNGSSLADYSSIDGLGSTVVLTVQFDVECHRSLDSTVCVRLTRSSNSGFGITINGSTEYSMIVISNIRWGSVAHRCGQLSVGDQLIAINDRHIGGDIHLATEILQQSSRLVSFVVIKQGGNLDLGYSSPGLPSVDSAVESWDSSEQNMLPISDLHRPALTSELQEDWRNRMNQSCNSIITQQSDNETCSSFRLSEGLLDEIASAQKQRGPIRKPPSPPCPLQTNYKLRNVNMANHWRGSSINNSNALNNLEALETELNIVAAQQNCPKTFQTFRGGAQEETNTNTPSDPLMSAKNNFQVVLHKDPVYEDFGFSVSDGLYERGVFINRIRPGGPADLSRMLQPYDRIIQVNETKTDDFDCCLTVPLVASAGNILTLTVQRHINGNRIDVKDEHSIPWVEDVEEEVIIEQHSSSRNIAKTL